MEKSEGIASTLTEQVLQQVIIAPVLPICMDQQSRRVCVV